MGALPSRECHESPSFFRFARCGPYAIANVALTEAYFPSPDSLAFRQVCECRERQSSKYKLDHLSRTGWTAAPHAHRAHGSLGAHGGSTSRSSPSSRDDDAGEEGGSARRAPTQSASTSPPTNDATKRSPQTKPLPFLIHPLSTATVGTSGDTLTTSPHAAGDGCTTDDRTGAETHSGPLLARPDMQKEVDAALALLHASNGLLVGVSAITEDNYHFFFDGRECDDNDETACGIPHELQVDPSATVRTGSPLDDDEAARVRRELYDMIVIKTNRLLDTNKKMCDIYAEEVRWRHARHTLRAHRRQQREWSEHEGARQPHNMADDGVMAAPEEPPVEPLSAAEVTALESVPAPKHFLTPLSEAVVVRMTLEEEHSARRAYYEKHPESRPEGFSDTYLSAGSGGTGSGGGGAPPSSGASGSRQRYRFEEEDRYKDGRIHLVEEDGVLYLFAYNTAPHAQRKSTADTTSVSAASLHQLSEEGQEGVMADHPHATVSQQGGHGHGTHDTDAAGEDGSAFGGLNTRQQSTYTAASFGGDDYEARIRQHDALRKQRRRERRMAKRARDGASAQCDCEDAPDEDDEDDEEDDEDEEDVEASGELDAVAQLLLETHRTFVLPICPVRIVAVCGMLPLTTYHGSPWLHGIEDDPEEILYHASLTVPPPVMRCFVFIDASVGEKVLSRASAMWMQTFTPNCLQAGLPETLVRPIIATGGLLDLPGMQLMRELRFRVRAAAAEVEQGDDWLRRLIQGTEYDLEHYIGTPNEFQPVEPNTAGFDDSDEDIDNNSSSHNSDGEKASARPPRGATSHQGGSPSDAKAPVDGVEAVPEKADQTSNASSDNDTADVALLSTRGTTQIYPTHQEGGDGDVPSHAGNEQERGDTTVGAEGAEEAVGVATPAEILGGDGHVSRAPASVSPAPTSSVVSRDEAYASDQRARNVALLRAFQKGLSYPRHASEISFVTSIRGSKSFWLAQASAQRHVLDLFSSAIIPATVAPYMKPISASSYDYGGTVEVHMVYPLHTAAALVKKTPELSTTLFAEEDAQVLSPPHNVRQLVAEELEREVYRQLYGAGGDDEPDGAFFSVPNTNPPPLRKVYVVTDLSPNARGPTHQHYLWKTRYSQLLAEHDRVSDTAESEKSEWAQRVASAMASVQHAQESNETASHSREGEQGIDPAKDGRETARKGRRGHAEGVRAGLSGANSAPLRLPTSSPLTVPVRHEYMYPATCFVEGDLVCYNVRKGRWEHFDPIFQREQQQRRAWQRQRHQREQQQQQQPQQRPTHPGTSTSPTTASLPVGDDTTSGANPSVTAGLPSSTTEVHDAQPSDAGTAGSGAVSGAAPAAKRVRILLEAEYPDDETEGVDAAEAAAAGSSMHTQDAAHDTTATAAASVATPSHDMADEAVLEDILLSWFKRKLQGVSLRSRHDPGWLRRPEDGRIVQEGRYYIWHFQHDGQTYYYGVVPKFARDGEKRKVRRRRQQRLSGADDETLSSGVSEASRELTGGDDDDDMGSDDNDSLHDAAAAGVTQPKTATSRSPAQRTPLPPSSACDPVEEAAASGGQPSEPDAEEGPVVGDDPSSRSPGGDAGGHVPAAPPCAADDTCEYSTSPITPTSTASARMAPSPVLQKDPVGASVVKDPNAASEDNALATRSVGRGRGDGGRAGQRQAGRGERDGGRGERDVGRRERRSGRAAPATKPDRSGHGTQSAYAPSAAMSSPLSTAPHAPPPPPYVPGGGGGGGPVAPSPMPMVNNPPAMTMMSPPRPPQQQQQQQQQTSRPPQSQYPQHPQIFAGQGHARLDEAVRGPAQGMWPGAHATNPAVSAGEFVAGGPYERQYQQQQQPQQQPRQQQQQQRQDQRQAGRGPVNDVRWNSGPGMPHGAYPSGPPPSAPTLSLSSQSPMLLPPPQQQQASVHGPPAAYAHPTGFTPLSLAHPSSHGPPSSCTEASHYANSSNNSVGNGTTAVRQASLSATSGYAAGSSMTSSNSSPLPAPSAGQGSGASVPRTHYRQAGPGFGQAPCTPSPAQPPHAAVSQPPQGTPARSFHASVSSTSSPHQSQTVMPPPTAFNPMGAAPPPPPQGWLPPPDSAPFSPPQRAPLPPSASSSSGVPYRPGDNHYTTQGAERAVSAGGWPQPSVSGAAADRSGDYTVPGPLSGGVNTAGPSHSPPFNAPDNPHQGSGYAHAHGQVASPPTSAPYFPQGELPHGRRNNKNNHAGGGYASPPPPRSAHANPAVSMTYPQTMGSMPGQASAAPSLSMAQMSGAIPPQPQPHMAATLQADLSRGSYESNGQSTGRGRGGGGGHDDVRATSAFIQPAAHYAGAALPTSSSPPPPQQRPGPAQRSYPSGQPSPSNPSQQAMARHEQPGSFARRVDDGGVRGGGGGGGADTHGGSYTHNPQMAPQRYPQQQQQQQQPQLFPQQPPPQGQGQALSQTPYQGLPSAPHNYPPQQPPYQHPQPYVMAASPASPPTGWHPQAAPQRLAPFPQSSPPQPQPQPQRQPMPRVVGSENASSADASSSQDPRSSTSKRFAWNPYKTAE